MTLPAAAPHYRVQPCPRQPGRWLVVHPMPGMPANALAWAVAADCATQAAAERECAWLEAERSAAATGHWRRHEPAHNTAACPTHTR